MRLKNFLHFCLLGALLVTAPWSCTKTGDEGNDDTSVERPQNPSQPEDEPDEPVIPDTIKVFSVSPKSLLEMPGFNAPDQTIVLTTEAEWTVSTPEWVSVKPFSGKGTLKEKLKLRDASSTLPELDDMAFLRDLGLTAEDNGQTKLTIAGLLFVGKDASIQKLLPQAEVIYLHYDRENLEEYNARLDMKQQIITVLDRLTEKVQNDNKIQNVQIGLFRLEIADFSEKVFQEALLNALSHRDYQQLGAVYVKHYPDKIVIENPGGFLDGITENNIITHPSVPRNKLIAETLQRLKYVQRTGQGVPWWAPPPTSSPPAFSRSTASIP